MRRCLVLSVFLIIISRGIPLAPAAAQESPTVKMESLSWLAGSWQSVENGRDTEEHWMSPKAGLMLGANRTINKRGTASFEFLRIAEVNTEGTDPGIVYYASPGGKPPVAFDLVESGEQSVVFQNLENEFPQRIFYHRENDKLTARIEGTMSGQEQSFEWHWDRKPE